MIRAVYIARLPDCLPLLASMGNDQLFSQFPGYKQHFKSITQSMALNQSPDPHGTLTADRFAFHFSIHSEPGLIFIALADRAFSKQQVFTFLNELRTAFLSQNEQLVEGASRPFAFLSFESQLEAMKKQVNEGDLSPQNEASSDNQIGLLKGELLDVSRIMTRNINELVQRGEKISKLGDLTAHLASESKKYAKDARLVNLRAIYRKYGPFVILGAVLLGIWMFYKLVY
jgi:vesicle transport protein SEC22